MNPRLLPSACVARSVLRTQSDSRLTELARAGSEPAFEAIVARYRRSLVRYCARMVGEGDAEEAVQEALLKAHAALLGGDPVRRLAPWLHVVAHNTALSYLRARSSRPQAADADYDSCATIDGSAEYRQELDEVLDAVRSLPERQRDAIVMRELEGRSYDEIAARLGSSHGAVRQLLHRARSSVRERLVALLPLEPLVRWAFTGAGGEAAGGATLSGACVAGAKTCAALLVPAAVALVASTSSPGPKTTTVARTRPVASTPNTTRAEQGTSLLASARVPAARVTAAVRYSSAPSSRSVRRFTAGTYSGVTSEVSTQRPDAARSSAPDRDGPAQPPAAATTAQLAPRQGTAPSAPAPAVVMPAPQPNLATSAPPAAGTGAGNPTPAPGNGQGNEPDRMATRAP